MLRDIPVPEMEALLMAHIDVDENAMRQLAVQRGVAVKDYLVGKGVAAARLFRRGADRRQGRVRRGSPGQRRQCRQRGRTQGLGPARRIEPGHEMTP
jgi:outer membrane protein OmpA-like peptidoglycan-associated protein